MKELIATSKTGPYCISTQYGPKFAVSLKVGPDRNDCVDWLSGRIRFDLKIRIFLRECALRPQVLEIRVIEKGDFQATPRSVDFMWTKSFTAQLSTPLQLCLKINLFFRCIQYTWNAKGLLVDWVYTIYDVGRFLAVLEMYSSFVALYSACETRAE